MASAIILAAGSGTRMNSALPKQYMDLAGLPVLTRTLMVFDKHPAIEHIFLVVSANDTNYCREHILSGSSWRKTVRLVTGGKKRQNSVYNGLKAAETNIGEDEIVLIHDGARPFVSKEMITACIEGAAESGACILGIPASDTLKRVDSAGIIHGTISRENVWMAQTPQAFFLKLIRDGFENVMNKGLSVTDDAAVLESAGIPVRIIPGSRTNMKITTPEDLDFAVAMVRSALLP